MSISSTSTRTAGDSAAPIVIVGGGLATIGAVKAIRRAGHDGDVTVISAEPHHPYERPPLSKDYLRRESDRTSVFTLVPEWYSDNGVIVRTAATVVDLDVAGRTLTVSDGSTESYSELLMATGSSPRPLSLPGADLLGVLSLRTLESSDLLRAALIDAREAGAGRLVVIGDGWIGLEVAASARMLGLEVTVLGHGAQPLAKVLGARMGAFYADVHTSRGVQLRRQVEVAAIEGTAGRVTGVTLSTGERIPADVVLVGVGAAPNIGLASAAGLALRDRALGGGVAVDGRLATSAPHVYAAGDIASIPSARYGRPLRVEHWATALRTGPHAARSMLGTDADFVRLPYFYSDQFDISMEYSGFVGGADDYDDLQISGDVDAASFVAFWTKKGVVQAGMTINTPNRIADVEKLITTRDALAPDDLRAFVTESAA
ncbi:FAD-dependent oxidoreductase [Microbacterium sp. M28]|uniref:NAD(P)/FAD-dependent oxidoreductase n=1 Tax=Microbacterium sp. M28 TaxID=2962064 RepID=UPI0021F460C2|nr:FAD-dependent oxidoreductase [Microbacterium sp. M28]UYO97052.1 FAD-dependent oxidoreductase [Microbacterium sp. M28]